MSSHDPIRRSVMTALASLPLLAAGLGAEASQPQKTGARILVAYFSRSGCTRVVAGLIQRSIGADLFEIQPATPYPADYLQTVDQARHETAREYEPPLNNRIDSIANYDVIFLGFPIWGGTTPPVIRSFLSSYDLTKKTIVPFILHGSYGVGDSLAVLRRRAPHSELMDGFVMEGPRERQTMERVKTWLNELQLISS